MYRDLFNQNEIELYTLSIYDTITFAELFDCYLTVKNNNPLNLLLEVCTFKL
jgi:hypothetical protein